MEDINNLQCDWETKYANCKYAERLVNKLAELNQQVTIPVNMDEVKKGIYYAKKYHGSQMRQSGDPYYSHPIEVAYMVAEYTALKMPKYYRTDMIITSLLHDTIEDTTLTEDMIGRVFGEQIASQVVDLTRVKSYGKISAAETLTLLCKHKKYDVAIIKIFDRIHNLQTLQAKSVEKIEKIVKESLKYFLIVVMHLEISIPIKLKLLNLCYQYIPTNMVYSFQAQNRLFFNNNPLHCFFPIFQNEIAQIQSLKKLKQIE